MKKLLKKTKLTQRPHKIIIDHREKNSKVIQELKNLNTKIEFKHLQVADYIIGKTAIERKTIQDLKNSIKNKRIVNQLSELKQYPQPLLITEGLENNPCTKGLHENALRGFLLSTALENKIPIIFTLNAKDTAKYLAILAKKKQKTIHPIRAHKSLLTEKEQLQYILEGFPQIGPATAKKLLTKFKTIKQISNTSQEQLKETIGKKAEKLHKLLNLIYTK